MTSSTETAIRPASIPRLPGTGSGTLSPERFFRNIRYVTLKVTQGCNLKCSYCNVDADLPTTPKMSIGTFRRVADLLIRNSRSPSVGLEFHGGEPLLLPDEWFTEAVGYAARLAREHGKRVDHPMQTNGTRLTDERVDFLRGLGIQFGVSFDGPPELNDRFRMAGKQVEKTLKRLIERDIRFGMILVLSRANCGRMDEVMEYFRELGISDYRINFLQPQGLGTNHQMLTAEEMFEGMRAVFDHMAATDCSVIEVGVQMIVNRFVHGRSVEAPLSCWEYECQAGRTYVAIDHTGAVYSCGTDLENHRLGHIDEPFDVAATRKTLGRLHAKDPWYARCFECKARRICSQSCPTSDFNDLRFRDASCEYTKLMYRHLCEHQDEVDRVYRALQAERPGSQWMR